METRNGDVNSENGDIAVVIVTWNSAKTLPHCLDSLADGASRRALDVVVVDNASVDGTPDLVRSSFPAVRLLETGANLGFAPAVNLALSGVQARYVMLLNPDTVAEPEALGQLADFLDAHPETGAAGPQLVRRDGTAEPTSARNFPGVGQAMFRHFGLSWLSDRLKGGRRPPDGTSVIPATCLSGAAVMLRKAVLDQVGRLDERLPMYFEDLDLCRRISLAGFAIYCVRSAVVVHAGGQSSRLSPDRRLLYAMEDAHAPWLYLKTYVSAAAAGTFRILLGVASLARLCCAALVAPMALPGASTRRGLGRLVGRAWACAVWSLTRPARFEKRVARCFPRPAKIATTGGRISVLVHNLNRADALRRCLDSIENQKHRPLEVVLLDAGSTDDSMEVVDAAEKRMHAVGIETRVRRCALMGVPASRNLAASMASGDTLCFLDNDARLEGNGCLAELAQLMATDRTLAVVAFRILDGDTDRPDPFAWVYRRSRRAWIGRAFESFVFTGGGFAVRADAFASVGGFWEELEYSREEEDLGLALIDRGRRIVYAPQLIVRHYRDSHGRASVRQRRFVELRNGTLVLWRRLPMPFAVAAIVAQVLTMSIRAVIRERHGVTTVVGALSEAVKRWRAHGLSRATVSWRAAWRYAWLHLSL
jgi:GT2 family glycosyltransferase